MRYKLIACKVLCRELSEYIATSPHVFDITWIRQGYHNEPDKLRYILNETIARIDDETDPGTNCGTSAYSGHNTPPFDAIILGYGLCSNGVCGVFSKKYPIIIPKVHDCIALFLGSHKRYKELFDEMSGGAYWYTAGWIENSFIPCEKNMQGLLEHYTKLYGEDNAEFLLQTENNWYSDYKFGAYIKPKNNKYPDYSEFTINAAKHFGWEYKEINSDMRLIENISNGDFSTDDFLIIPPNHTAVQSYDDKILCCNKK